MLCYKDRTFCKNKDCKKFEKCDRALTDKVKAAAEMWWGNKNPPVCFYADQPECFEAK